MSLILQIVTQESKVKYTGIGTPFAMHRQGFYCKIAVLRFNRHKPLFLLSAAGYGYPLTTEADAA